MFNQTQVFLTNFIHNAFLSEKITRRECKVLIKRLAGKTLKDVGQDFGVGQGRIRQLEANAIRRLKNSIRFKQVRKTEFDRLTEDLYTGKAVLI